MIGTIRRRLLFAGALFLLVVGASALSKVSQANSPAAMAEELRGQLREVRVQLDACLATQDRVELRFQQLTRQTDRLRDELDALESLDPRGVPSDRYAVYLELVEEFNRSIPEWERQADELRARSSHCRALVEVHNSQVDSLQRLLVEAGIWEEAWLYSSEGNVGSVEPDADTGESAPEGSEFPAPDPGEGGSP